MHITINNRKIGPDHPVYIIAEMSANHHQDFHQAVRILEAAKAAGADAVKLQTYTPDTLTLDCDNAYFRIKGTIWEGKNLHQLYGEAFTPWEWQPKLKDIADQLGLDLFSTPFDDSAVDFLEQMGVPAHKVASFEIVDSALLRKIGTTGKPVILSTGMASLREIDEAVSLLQNAGTTDIALLKCTSAYPAAPEDMNLRTIPHLSHAFGLPAGLSDHTTGIAAPVAAVALGACIIEKHLTLSRADKGPDSAFSLEPAEFQSMVTAVREAQKALGRICYTLSEKEAASRIFRRSLFVVRDMKAGEEFTEKTVRSIRPGYGLHPRYLDTILGRRSSCTIEKGTPLDWTHVGAASPHSPE
ncbi:MAG: pseudaminic acid synthase [Pseudomonadota bacterium]